MTWWVRHGQSTWNAIDRMQGHELSPPLTDLGRAQAAAAAERLVGAGAARILTSPAVRATQTAAILAERLALDVTTDVRLLEKGLDESVADVLGRITDLLADPAVADAIVVSHGDTIGLAVGLLSGRPPVLPGNASITTVDPGTRDVHVT